MKAASDEKDVLDELAAKIMENAADTTDQFRDVALAAGYDVETALKRLAKMFRAVAGMRQKKPQP